MDMVSPVGLIRNKGLLLKNNSIFGMHHVPLLQNSGMFHLRLSV